MAYMVMQRVITAVRQGYADRDDAADQQALARACKAWLASLAIDPTVRNELLEPISAIEGALADILRSPASYRRQAEGT